jgi:excisionase family DNA binding protein
MAQSELFFDEPPVRENADVRLQPVTTARALGERPIRARALLLTVREVADRLGCGRTLVYELISSGELETIKLGRLRRVPVAALEALVERLRVDARAD